HAGVGRLTIIDDDIAEEANRSRVISMTPQDVAQRTPKVEILMRYGQLVNPAIRIDAIKDSVEDVDVQRLVREADFIFGCTDNIASRVPLNRLVYQYLIPMLDMGMDLQRKERPGAIRAAAGRVMLVQPDGPCLECMGIITGEALSREGGRRPCKDEGGGDPENHAASAIFLNGVVASLAVTRWVDTLGAFQRDRKPGLYEMFLPLHGTMKFYAMEPEAKCTLCKELRGFADGLALPGGTGGE
ncbi:MAG: HesA/MoeB/ThiF family protein, partial [Gammaproteobacteria bacterium]